MARMIELKTSEIPAYQHRLTIFQKMILGALGALTPVLLNLYAVDFEKLFMNQQITVPYLIGYIVRILILILYGSLIAFFHRDENSPVKLFQLGVAFPAIVTILLSGVNSSVRYVPQQETNSTKPVQMPAVKANNAATSAYKVILAQYQQPVQAIEPVLVNEFDTKRNSPFIQFIQGFLGTMPQVNTFAVLLGNEIAWNDALNDYQFYNHNYPEFDVQLYRSYNNNEKYVLVLGNKLTETAALQIQNAARRSGLLATVVDLRKTI